MPVPPLVVVAHSPARRQLLGDYFHRTGSRGTPPAGRGRPAERAVSFADEDGNRFSDRDIVNHMIFLMMAARHLHVHREHVMVYHPAETLEWQQRCRDEVDRLGDGPLDIEALEKLESLDLVMNEVDPDGHAGAMGDAAHGARHRLAPATTSPGNERHLLSGNEPPVVRDLDGARVLIRPGSPEPRNEHKRHRYGFTPFGGGAQSASA